MNHVNKYIIININNTVKDSFSIKYIYSKSERENYNSDCRESEIHLYLIKHIADFNNLFLQWKKK